MKSPRFPAFLDLRDRLCVVVGGGAVATRKAKSLLDCEAVVRVIAPRASSDIVTLAAEKRLEWLERAYRSGDLAEAWLALAATDDPDVNHQVVAEASARRVLALATDANPNASATSGSAVRRGGVTVSISSDGRSPAFTRLLRERLEQVVETEVALLDLMAELRLELKDHGSVPDADMWRAAIDQDVRQALERGDRIVARDRLAARLGVTKRPLESPTAEPNSA